MALEKVIQYFKENNIENKLQVLKESAATVELAAEAIGCEPCQIAKTLSFVVEDRAVLVVMAGDARINNKAFKDTFGKKPRMIAREDVEALVGHAPGGVCPFAIKDDVDVYLDESLKRFEIVYPSGGASNSMVKMTLQELEQYACNMRGWVNIGKDWF